MFSSQQQHTAGTMPWNRFVTTYSRDYRSPSGDQHPWVTQVMLRPAPAALSLPQTVGMRPWETYVTTYNGDYKPFSEWHPQVPEKMLRTEAAAETTCEICPIFLHHFYRTTNGTYDPSGFLQVPPCAFFSYFLPTLGTFTPCVQHVSSLMETGKPEAGVDSETSAPLSKEEEGQLHCGAVLEEQKAQETPPDKFDIVFGEGVTVTTYPVSPACCKNFVRYLCREAGQQDLLHLPVTSAPFNTVNAAEGGSNSNYLRGLNPVDSTILQPTTYSCFSQDVVCPYKGNVQFQPPPSDSQQTPPQVQPTVYHREPSRGPWLTEYQASYSAGRF